MERVIVENPRPARRLALLPCSLGAIAVVGVLTYSAMYGRPGEVKHGLAWLGTMIPAFALVGMQVRRVLSPKGKWVQSDEGLKFESYSGKTSWTIPWQRIMRMKNTSVSLVIRWKDGQQLAQKAVLLLAKPEADELVDLWHAHCHGAGKSETVCSP